MKILVADDEDACRQLLHDMFATDPRVQLTMARDGAEAWWKLTDPAERYDLAIFDRVLRRPTPLAPTREVAAVEQLHRLG